MNKQELERVKSVVRNIPDFPVPGIQFKDLTTAFKDPEALQIMTKAMADIYRDKGVTRVVGIEARGFIGGAILATQLNAGFVPLRKPGTLPAMVIQKSYTKASTGGTMLAAYELVKSMNPKKIYINFICDLEILHGRDVFPPEVEITTLFTF